MTRKSHRELERDIEQLRKRRSTAGGSDVTVVWRDDQTDELVDRDGEPTDPDPDADMVVVIDDRLVMDRERAEREGREILGPAEDVPNDRDVVRVARERP